MNVLLLYMVKASVYLAAFYLVYELFLGRDTMYRRNRIYILLSVIFSLILPLIRMPAWSSFKLPLIGKVLSDVFIYADQGQMGSSGVDAAGRTWMQGIAGVYLAGIILFGIKFLIDLGEITALILRNKRRGNHIIRFQGFNTAGFSAFGHIFVNGRLTDEEAGEIIRHEQNHLDRNHSFDIIFLEVIKVLQWFNPVIHMFDRSLRAVHEYQADEGCLKRGVPLGTYQRLILNQVFKSKVFTVTSSFSSPTLIKKRMIMMTKKRSNALANLKLLVVVPVIALVLVFISSCSQKNEPAGNSVEMAPPPPPPPPPAAAASETQDTPFEVVDEMPVFSGGEEALINFVAKNTRYPEAAKAKGIQGKVVVRFVVEADGRIGSIRVLKGADPELDKEAVRVIGTLPAFEKPGIKDGKAVAVWFALPINFFLK